MISLYLERDSICGTKTMDVFASSLQSDRVIITCELNPPKGTNLEPMTTKASMLRSRIDAFNVTDSAGSRMAMAPISAAHLLLDEGIDPILQITSRDRNRLAIQSEILAAAGLGISNVLCMSGDPPGTGDHPEAKAIFDIDAVGILQAINFLRQGTDMAGNNLSGSPEIFPGAVVNPGSDDLDKELHRMEAKVEAGAHFFQTQAVYDPGLFELFMKSASQFDVPILAGLIVLKSGRMARNLNANLPGVQVPDSIIAEMENSAYPKQTSTAISARLISEIAPLCRGIHIMAIGWESLIPKILDAADVPASR